MKKKFIIIQPLVPSYRSNFFLYLSRKIGDSFNLYAGEKSYDSTLQSDKEIDYKKLKNFYFLKGKLIFQTGMWQEVFKDCTLIIGLNPRNISNWIILFIRRFLPYKTIVWGHAWPRKGIQSKTDIVRSLMRNLADGIITYSVTQKNELKEKGYKKPIYSAPNAIYSASEVKNFYEENPLNILYVGRFIDEKKISLLIRAFAELIFDLPEKTRLILVGSGYLEKDLRKLVDKLEVSEKVIFAGYITNIEKIESFYSKSLVTISPGTTGLFLNQSLMYGIPMIIARGEAHGPEIEAAIEGENIVYFENDNIEDLKLKILKTFDQKEIWISKREKISEFCKKYYSIEAMASIFIEIYKDHES